MKKLRIMIISHMFPRLSLERHGIFLCREADYLSQHGIECSFLVPTPIAPWPVRCFRRWKVYAEGYRLCCIDGLSSREVTSVRPPGGWFLRLEGRSMYLSLLRAARRWHEEVGFDLVMGCPMLPDGEAAVWVSERLGLPLVSLSIGSDVLVHPRGQPVLEKKIGAIVSRSDLVVGVSEAICRRLSETGRCKRAPLCVYLGRDSKAFCPPEDKDAVRHALGWAVDETIAVYVGLIAKTKGMEELVSACEVLLGKYGHFRLVCVGDGPAMGLLEQLQCRLGGKDAVTLAGRVSPDEVVKYLQGSDFMVFPSHSEGMPQAVLEAANCGIGSVATRVGGIPEAIVDGVNGLLIDAKSADALLIAMERMICDVDFRLQAGRKSLEMVTTRFDGEQNARRFADALWSLTNGDRGNDGGDGDSSGQPS